MPEPGPTMMMGTDGESGIWKEGALQNTTQLEALGERRPPWPRQIITPILPNVKVLSLGSERLTPKVLDHYLHHDLVRLPLQTVFCFLLIYSS